MYKLELKKPWVWRGKTYPKGSVFELISRGLDKRGPGAWYSIAIPKVGHGFVYFPDLVFRQLTPADKIMKAARERESQEHLAKSRSRDRRLIL
jgi:hypothetical protein